MSEESNTSKTDGEQPGSPMSAPSLKPSALEPSMSPGRPRAVSFGSVQTLIARYEDPSGPRAGPLRPAIKPPRLKSKEEEEGVREAHRYYAISEHALMAQKKDQTGEDKQGQEEKEPNSHPPTPSPAIRHRRVGSQIRHRRSGSVSFIPQNEFPTPSASSANPRAQSPVNPQLNPESDDENGPPSSEQSTITGLTRNLTVVRRPEHRRANSSYQPPTIYLPVLRSPSPSPPSSPPQGSPVSSSGSSDNEILPLHQLIPTSSLRMRDPRQYTSGKENIDMRINIFQRIQKKKEQEEQEYWECVRNGQPGGIWGEEEGTEQDIFRPDEYEMDDETIDHLVDALADGMPFDEQGYDDDEVEDDSETEEGKPEEEHVEAGPTDAKDTK